VLHTTAIGKDDKDPKNLICQEDKRFQQFEWSRIKVCPLGFHTKGQWSRDNALQNAYMVALYVNSSAKSLSGRWKFVHDINENSNYLQQDKLFFPNTSRKGIFGAPSYSYKTSYLHGPWDLSWCPRPMWAPNFATVAWCSRTTFLLVKLYISGKEVLEHQRFHRRAPPKFCWCSRLPTECIPGPYGWRAPTCYYEDWGNLCFRKTLTKPTSEVN
jgi:hypothetical protein